MVRTSSFGVLAEIHMRDSSSRCKLTWPVILSLREPILDQMQGNLWHVFCVWTGIPTNKLCQIAENRSFWMLICCQPPKKILGICGGMDGLINQAYFCLGVDWRDGIGRIPASGTLKTLSFFIPNKLVFTWNGCISKWWQLKYFWIFTPNPPEIIQWDSYLFANRLVQPPTRYT